MSRDGCVESAGSPNSLRMSGKAGSRRSIDMAAIAMHVAMNATKVRPPSSIRRRSIPCRATGRAIPGTLCDEGPHRSEVIDVQDDLVARSQPWIAGRAVDERELEDAARAARSRADDVASFHPRGPRGVGDHLAEAPVDVGQIGSRVLTPVDDCGHGHVECLALP